jgi:DNA-directed RNA polymerase subunit alpha
MRLLMESQSILKIEKYSQEDLLEFKNFGQKSADEVCDSLQIRFGKTLQKSVF